jgi:hypothetical protein
MRGRRVLPAETGVLYAGGETHVLWAFEALELPLGGRRIVRDVLSGQALETDCLAAAARRIYTIDAPHALGPAPAPGRREASGPAKARRG